MSCKHLQETLVHVNSLAPQFTAEQALKFDEKKKDVHCLPASERDAGIQQEDIFTHRALFQMCWPIGSIRCLFKAVLLITSGALLHPDIAELHA